MQQRNLFTEEVLKLANSEIMKIERYAFEEVLLNTALATGINLKAYFDGDIYGNYNEISTGKDLVEYVRT